MPRGRLARAESRFHLSSRLGPSPRSDPAYYAFIRVVDRYFVSRGSAYAISDGVLRLTENSRQNREYGLSNLVLRCASLSLDEYAVAVESHFDALFAVEAGQTKFESDAEDFDKIKERLRVRLYNADYVARAGSAQVSRREADDLFAGLVLDLPNAVRNVGADLIEGWSRPLTDVFELALSNVLSEAKFEREVIHTKEGELVNLYSPNYYAATHALWADTYVDDPPTNGLLVAVPNRHEILIVPIRGARAATSVPLLYATARVSFDALPGSITTSIFWRRSIGTFERVAAESKENHLALVASDEFRDMVKRLSAS